MEAQILKEALRSKGYDVDNFSKEALNLIHDVMNIVENQGMYKPYIEGKIFR